MSLAFRQLRVYVRLALILVVVLTVGLVLVKNRGNEVPVWFLWFTDDAKPVNVVWLMLSTAAGTLVSWWAFSLGWGVWRDMREMRRLRTINEATKNLEQRASTLDQRERRIDQKLKNAIGQEQEVGDE